MSRNKKNRGIRTNEASNIMAGLSPRL
jgi:hypothetical protein